MQDRQPVIRGHNGAAMVDHQVKGPAHEDHFLHAGRIAAAMQPQHPRSGGCFFFRPYNQQVDRVPVDNDPFLLCPGPGVAETNIDHLNFTAVP